MGIFTTTVYLASRDFNNSSTTEAGWSAKYLSFFSSGFNRPKFCSQKEKALVGTLRGEDPCRIPLVMSTCEQKCLVMLTYSSNLLFVQATFFPLYLCLLSTNRGCLSLKRRLEIQVDCSTLFSPPMCLRTSTGLPGKTSPDSFLFIRLSTYPLIVIFLPVV